MEKELESNESEETSEKEYEKHEISCAVDTILKAEEIKADAKMWPIVRDELKKKGVAVNKAIKTFKDLKDVAYEKTKAT